MDERQSSRDHDKRRPHHFESIYGQRADPRRGGWKGPRSQPPAQRLPQTLPPIDAPPPVPSRDILETNELPDPVAPTHSRSHHSMRRPVPERVLRASNGAGWGAPKHAHLAPLPNQPVAPVAPSEPRGSQGRRPQPKGLRNVMGSPGVSSQHRPFTPEAEELEEIVATTPERTLASTQDSAFDCVVEVAPRAFEETAPRAEALNFDFHESSACSDPDGSQESANLNLTLPEQRASAKSVSVAALQKLFFEELAKGNDANGAAAQALLRLNESGPTSNVLEAEDSRSQHVSRREGDALCNDEEDGFSPRQPTPLVGGSRSQAIRVSNCQ
eukprot:gnl/MRDRNA2_/MRDRNA2_153654_c0_seq1.p1 gnl/MRDRNA2_/MRDRNA2_153654_c0~~gnl/MRDRNA2_/MRDRNA2_153654_c0_seq1.p1  ORF type:complete len:328 (+),score=60.00 gnl/MRDRNA2_/MRDRNA2_153654_c0_seq1:156-1139(+)